MHGTERYPGPLPVGHVVLAKHPDGGLAVGVFEGRQLLIEVLPHSRHVPLNSLHASQPLIHFQAYMEPASQPAGVPGSQLAAETRLTDWRGIPRLKQAACLSAKETMMQRQNRLHCLLCQQH